MRSSWQTRTLAELSEDVAYGYTESAVAEKVGPHFLRITDIQNGIVEWGAVPFCTIKPRDHAKYKLNDGDIVIARTGNSTGENFLYRGSKDAVFASYLIRFRIDSSVADPAYVWYNLRSPQWWSYVAGARTGSAQAGANAKVLGNFKIELPPLPEQRAIAKILGSLDDKIELNRRMNRTLEAMARALFKSWFVDFDPVRANAAGHPTLPPDLAALFPSEFEPSELGDIPKGWEVRSLDSIANFLNGLALQKYPAKDGVPTLPVLKIAQLRKGDTSGSDRCNSTLPEKYIVHDGDVIFSWSGSLLVRIWTGGDAALNQHLFKVTSKEFPRWFYYHWTLHHLDSFQQTAASKATTMGHIKRHHLNDAKVHVPAPDVVGRMTAIIEPLHKQAIMFDLESRTLAALRDSLLPKLLSGELSVAAGSEAVA